MKGSGVRFVKAYTRIIRDPRLTPVEKALWLCLKTYCGADDLCIPSVATICAHLNINRKTFHKAMLGLEALNIVNRVRRDDRGNQTSNQYLFTDAHFAKHCALLPRPKKRAGMVAQKTGHE